MMQFTFRFRLTETAVNFLLTEIMLVGRFTSSRNNGVSSLRQLLLTLRLYALGTMLISLADFVGVSKSTAAIAHFYDIYIVVHQRSVEKFYEIAEFPRVLGAIDCAHIRKQYPSQCDAGQFDGRWLLGDSAYPNRTYLLLPLLNPSSEAEHRYNEAHIRIPEI